MIRNTFVPVLNSRQEAYQNYLRNSWRWKLIRKARLWVHRRWHGEGCLVCPNKGNLHVHHRKYEDMDISTLSWLNVWSLFLEFCDTRVLCETCHRNIHDGRKISDFAD